MAMVEILGSSTENRSPFQGFTFELEETGVVELLEPDPVRAVGLRSWHPDTESWVCVFTHY